VRHTGIGCVGAGAGAGATQDSYHERACNTQLASHGGRSRSRGRGRARGTAARGKLAVRVQA